LTHTFQGKEWQDGFGYDFLTRTYDPYTMRMLQVDGANQFASGYVGMGNNPVSMIDPDGQVAIAATTITVASVLKAAAIGASVGGAFYTASVATSYGGFQNWNWGQFVGSVAMGAVNGALAHVGGIKIVNFGHGLGMSITPQVSFGSDGFSLGANTNFGFKYKNINGGITAGANLYSSNVTGTSGVEGRFGGVLGFTAGNFQTSLSTMQYITNGTSQRTGLFKIGGQNWNLQYENDWHPVLTDFLGASDGGDRFRTAALKLSIKDFSAGFNLFTGDPNVGKDRPIDPNILQETYNGGTSDKYRLGAAFFGYQNYRVGANSERIRHSIQNRLSHDILNPGTPHFKVLNNHWNSYFRVGKSNPLSLW
jgi:RHS repeat-associated protein